MDAAPRTIELLERSRTGDAAAAQQLVLQFEVPLRRFIARRLGRSLTGLVTVDDVFQETHMEALSSLPTFTYRRKGCYLAWLFTIARRCIARAATRLERTPEPISALSGGARTSDLLAAVRSPVTSPAERADRSLKLERLVEALTDLPERRREAIVLRYLEGLETAECARILEVEPPVFRTLLSRARRQLADILEEAIP